MEHKDHEDINARKRGRGREAEESLPLQVETRVEPSTVQANMDSAPVVLNHSHGHAQWQAIAEQFSSLLDDDFVDIVFRVRGKHKYLGAHRVLVAAAWPVLRDELRNINCPASPEVRKSSLAWVDPYFEDVEAPCEPAATPLSDPTSPSPSGPRISDQFRTPSTQNCNLQISPPPSSHAARRGIVTDRCLRWNRQNSVEIGELQHTMREPTPPGVLDVSSRVWGNYNIMRALLCHLYSRPVVIHEKELSILRLAAQGLGSTELARCCDDKDRFMARLERTTTSKAASPEDVEPLSPAQLRTKQTAPLPSVREYGSSASTSAASCGIQREEDGSTRSQDDTAHIHGAQSGGTSALSYESRSEKSQVESQDGGNMPVRVSSKTHFSEAGDAKPRTMTKPRGEWSFTDKSCSEKPSAETGGVRRVLSEIKRSIVESSRIIADESFQQIYEMVPGERGILGEGINGPVRMARHRRTGQEVAVKRISCVNLSEQRRQMLVSEVRIFLQVSHRNVVQLLEVYESEVDQAVLLVMELCTGKELFERLAERRWYSEFDAARVARQMLDAVSYLHSSNICHRDLKLENWLYANPSAEARLKLCDFGFGQIVEPSVQLTATLGSLYYVAPEVLEGSYGLPCDIWSIGVIVYMLLSGVPPFDGKTDADVMGKIRQGRFVSTGKRWEGISDSAKHFLRSMLRKDPYERLSAAEAAQHAWLKMECQPKTLSWSRGNLDADFDLPIDRGVIRDVWKFAQNNAVTRAALGMLAKLNSSSFGGHEEDVQLLEQRFKSADDQNTGKIDAEAFIQILKETLQISSADEKQFFERIAGNLSGDNRGEAEQKRRRREVNYVDFVTITKARRMANNTAAIREAFRCFDSSGDGFIKEDDMHNLLGNEFQKTIENYVDENGKEFIDYAHFANVVAKEMAEKDSQEVTKDDLAVNADTGLARQNEAIQRLPSEASGCHSSTSNAHLDADLQHGPTPVEIENENKDGIAANDSREPLLPQQGSSQDCANAARHENKDVKTVEAEGEEEEECDADAESDEEQLVNVKPAETAVLSEDALPQEEKPRTSNKDVKESSRFPSFSLSLAGSAEYDDMGISRVMSMPSDVYSIRQLPNFHSTILRPFYAARPVSNVVMGLIRGTSLYARQSVAAKLATIIHTTCGWFFIMPNPKYHTEVDTRKGLLSKEMGKFRFVAWWIHPRFVPQLRQWFERLTYEGLDQDRQEQRREARAQHEARAQREPRIAPGGDRERVSAQSCADKTPGGSSVDKSANLQYVGSTEKAHEKHEKDSAVAGSGMDTAVDVRPEGQKAPIVEPQDLAMGSPGDFRFSDVPKPDSYLHTYRDLHTREHVNMLSQLYEGSHRFLRSLFDETFMTNARISSGFHYPVRSQYATLHMQLRVNSGSVCRDDGRGIEVNTLIENMKRDRRVYERDEDTVRYKVTENVKVSLLAAAQEYEEQNAGESACRQTSPLTYELGLAGMPTIQDESDEEEEVVDGTPGSETNSVDRQKPTSVSAHAAEEDTAPCNAAESHPAGITSVSVMSAVTDGGKEKIEMSTYLVNLQPVRGSLFFQVMNHKRESSADLFGNDPTYLYPLHASVTGFFEANPRCIQDFVSMMNQLLASELSAMSRVSVGEVICTKTGYVLLDIVAPSIAAFAVRLKEKAHHDFGIHIRPKAVNHISLACNRPHEETRLKMQENYSLSANGTGDEFREACASAQFDIVLSKLLRRSAFEALAKDGPHSFEEVVRIPVMTPTISSDDNVVHTQC